MQRGEFEEEVSLYRDPTLRKVLPHLVRVNDNKDGTVRSRSGYVMPPFFVLERGVTLREWAKAEHGTPLLVVLSCQT